MEGVKLSSKTRFLNIFRRMFMNGSAEKFLLKRTIGNPPESFWGRIVPPNFLYPKNSHRVAERNGVKYQLDISDYVEHYIYFGFHDDSHEELFRLAAGKKTLIDVGVNIGSVIMNFAHAAAPGAVIAGFEPDEKNFAKASANIALNGFTNINLVKKGAGEKTSTVKLYRVDETNEGMNRILPNENAAALSNSEEIEIVTLDSFAAENKLLDIDLIKIDVEGYELNVLRGAKHTLQTQRPILFIELDDKYLRDNGDSARSLITFLHELGYSVRRSDSQTPLAIEDDFTGCHFDIVCEKLSDQTRAAI